MLDVAQEAGIAQQLDRHREQVLRIVQYRLAKGSKPIFRSRWREVAECLLARNASLYDTMAMNPLLLTVTVAPMVLRAMIEVLINISYIAKKPKERSIAYMEHGLGSAILWASKAEEASEEEEGMKELLEEQITELMRFVEWERARWAVDVNLGDWAGNNVRKRAKEGGLNSLYRHAWGAFSDAVHSTWTHVGRINGVRCRNPLHRGHLRGRITQATEGWHPDFLYRAAKYLDMTLDVYDRAFRLKPRLPRVQELCPALPGEVEEMERRRIKREQNRESEEICSVR